MAKKFMTTLWGNREGKGLSDLRMNFKTKFMQSRRKNFYCQQCFRYDKIFRGKLEVHYNPFTNSIWVEFCDVSIRNRHTGEETCYDHSKMIVFTIENKAKCLKFLKYIMRCAEIEMDFPQNKERIIRELKFHETMKGKITRELESYEKMKKDEDKKNQMKKKHEEEKDEVNFKFDSKTEWPELSKKKVKEEKLDEKTKEEEERKHEELFNFHSKTEWPDLMEME